MKLSQAMAETLTESFPSRTTVQIGDVNVSAAGLAAFVVALIQRGESPAELTIHLGLAYSGGASGDLEADMPAICRNVQDVAGKQVLAGVVRELCAEGYTAAFNGKTTPAAAG